MKIFLCIILSMSLFSCLGYPDKVKPVKNFVLNKYLGKWYEIARLDHSFERGLSKVSAEYSLRDGGGVKVLNRGYNAKENEWTQAEGKAFFVEDTSTAYLKVTFFWPFYGSYVVFELDKNYQYAFVSGPDLDYLWFLSRTPKVSKELITKFKEKAAARGFDASKLIFVEQ